MPLLTLCQRGRRDSNPQPPDRQKDSIILFGIAIDTVKQARNPANTGISRLKRRCHFSTSFIIVNRANPYFGKITLTFWRKPLPNPYTFCRPKFQAVFYSNTIVLSKSKYRYASFWFVFISIFVCFFDEFIEVRLEKPILNNSVFLKLAFCERFGYFV